MSELCYICLNSNCNWRSYTDPRSGHGGKKGRTEISCLSSVKILTSYILQTSKSSSSNNGDMEKLRQNILSSFGEGQFSICNNCFMKAKDLLDLHLELEKIQMQILDVLKGLQDYLVKRAGETSLEVVEDLKNLVVISRFQDVLFKEFVHHDLSDGSQVRLDRLQSMGFPNSIPLLLPNDVENLEGFINEDIELHSYSPFDASPEIEIKPAPIGAKRARGRPLKWPMKPTSSNEKRLRQDGDGVVGLAFLRLNSEATDRVRGDVSSGDLTYSHSNDVGYSIEDTSSPMTVETRKREINTRPIVAKRGYRHLPKIRKIQNSGENSEGSVVSVRMALLGSQVTNLDRDEVISGGSKFHVNDDCGGDEDNQFDHSSISLDQIGEEEMKPVIEPKRGSNRRPKLHGTSPPNDIIAECSNELLVPTKSPENVPIASDPEFSDADEDTDEDKDFSSSDEEFNPKSHTKKAKRGRRPLKNTKQGTGGGSNCDICLKKIPFNLMESHLKTHPEFEKYYECDLCPPVRKPRKFGTYKGLVWHHFKATHKVPLLSCVFCPAQRTRYEKKKLCEHLYEVHYPNHTKLQCEKEDCSEEFYDPYSLQCHQKQEHGDAIYPCDVCQKRFKTKGYMCSHRIDIHGKGLRFQCTYCSEDFKTVRKLRKHEESHEESLVPSVEMEKQEKVPVQCPYCSKTVSTLSSHIKNVHEADPSKVQRSLDRPSKPIKVKRPIGRPRNPNSRRRERGNLSWDCDICLESIPFKQHEYHLKTHPEFEKYYKCELCPNHRWTRQYGTYKGLIWHYLRASHKVKLACQLCPDQSFQFGRKELCKHLYDCHYPNLKKLQCKVEGCSEQFYEHQSLRDHRMQQHPETAYRCALCPRIFATKYVLQKHMEKDPHGRKKERFQCASCPKDFGTMSALRSHEKTHEEGWVPKPKVKEQCPHCAATVSAGSLSTHIKSVHAEKSLICRFCGKAFGLKFHLKRHEDAHRGERKYKCTKCSYAGTTSSSLNSHMRLHREKTFQCQYCPKAFPIKRYWEDHERTHTKEKPYQCEQCEMAFNARNMLSAHRRKKHGIAAVQQCLAGVGVTIMDEEEQEKRNYNKVEPCPEKIEFPQ